MTDLVEQTKDGIDWHVIAEAVSEAISNAEGQISAYYLEHYFRKAEIGVFHAPDLPVSYEEHARLQSALTEAQAQVEVMRGGLDSALAEIDGLRAAIDAGDPKAELLVRVGDVRRIVSASLSTPPTAVGRVMEAGNRTLCGMPVMFNPALPADALEFHHPDGRVDRFSLAGLDGGRKG